MKPNVGTTDKIIRLALAVLALILYFFTSFGTGVMGIILLVVAGLLVVTSLINFCPLYFVLRLKTNNKE